MSETDRFSAVTVHISYGDTCSRMATFSPVCGAVIGLCLDFNISPGPTTGVCLQDQILQE